MVDKDYEDNDGYQQLDELTHWPWPSKSILQRVMGCSQDPHRWIVPHARYIVLGQVSCLSSSISKAGQVSQRWEVSSPEEVVNNMTCSIVFPGPILSYEMRVEGTWFRWNTPYGVWIKLIPLLQSSWRLEGPHEDGKLCEAGHRHYPKTHLGLCQSFPQIIWAFTNDRTGCIESLEEIHDEVGFFNWCNNTPFQLWQAS